MARQDYRPYIAGLTVSVLWGFSFLFTQTALEKVAPTHLLGLRFALASMLFTFLRCSGFIKVDFKGKDIKGLLLLTLVQPVSYFTFETIGISMTSSSETGMMMAAIPVITTGLGALFLREKPTGLQTGFMMLSVAGVVFNILMKGRVQIGSNPLGSLVVLMAVIIAGIFNILSRKFSRRFTPMEITYAMMMMGAVVFNGYSISQHGVRGSLSTYFQPFADIRVLISVLYLGILASVVGYFLNNFMLSKLEAVRASVFANLITVCSIVAGVTLGDEKFYTYNLLGAGMIMVGVWGTNYFAVADKDELTPIATEEI